MWRKYRTVVEILQAMVIVGLPFVRINNQSALRFDIEELKLYFFGTVIWIKEFYLFLLLIILFLLLIAYVTTIYGRVWCGWLCPQTVLLDFSSALAGLSRTNPYKKEIIQKAILVPLSALVSLTLIWYFVPPAETIKRLFMSKTLAWFFLIQWAVIYAELALLGRKFCTSICPYSMLQSGLFDNDTVVISFKERTTEHCMGCDKCVRVCPVGIDIKRGLKRECIACAECIDACISMTEKRGIKPFIGYTGRPWRLKNLVLGLIVLLFAVVLVVMFNLRPEVEFVISRDPVAPVRNINSYTYSLYNNTNKDYSFRLSVNSGFIIIGNTTVRLKPYGSTKGKIMVRRTGNNSTVRFTLKSDGVKIQREAGFL